MLIATARCLLLAVLALMPALPIRGEEPFSFASAPGRLPKDVVPLDYTVDIVPNITALILAGSESCAIASPLQLTAGPQHPSRAPHKSLCSRR
jgi:hypothetical protein